MKYKETTKGSYAETRKTTGYIATLICLIVILVLVIVGLTIYRCVAAQQEKVSKNEVPKSIKSRDEFEEVIELEKQYVPGFKDLTSPGFGGISFERTPKRRMDSPDDTSEMKRDTGRGDDSMQRFSVMTPDVSAGYDSASNAIDIGYYLKKTKRTLREKKAGH